MSPIRLFGDWCASCCIRPMERGYLCIVCSELQSRDLPEMSRQAFHEAIYEWLDKEAA